MNGARFGMTQALTFAPTDQGDLLTLVADAERATGRDAVADFLAACKTDADAHGGEVSVNRVSAALPDDFTSTERYSALWSHFTGKGKPMRKADERDPRQWEFREGSKSGNNGKPMRLRVWVACATCSATTDAHPHLGDMSPRYGRCEVVA